MSNPSQANDNSVTIIYSKVAASLRRRSINNLLLPEDFRLKLPRAAQKSKSFFWCGRHFSHRHCSSSHQPQQANHQCCGCEAQSPDITFMVCSFGGRKTNLTIYSYSPPIKDKWGKQQVFKNTFCLQLCTVYCHFGSWPICLSRNISIAPCSSRSVNFRIIHLREFPALSYHSTKTTS